jgi:hypothetical protein
MGITDARDDGLGDWALDYASPQEARLWRKVREARAEAEKAKGNLTDAVMDLADHLKVDRAVAFLLLADYRSKPGTAP